MLQQLFIMKSLLFKTNANNYSALLIRLFLGVVMLSHGSQKMLGLFGGYGFGGTMQFLTGEQGPHLPTIVAFAVIVTEFFGALLILLGFLTRFWSLAMAGMFLGIMVMGGQIQNGFFMNWFGNQKGEGIEFSLLIIGMCLSLIVSGGGKASIDAAIDKK